MFRLIAKRGVIQNHIKTKSPTVDFRINTLDIECRWQYQCEDLEKDDDIIIVGYIGNDEYADPILYGCAYFNISKSVKSSNTQQSWYWIGGLVIAMFSIAVTYWQTIRNQYIIAVLIFLFITFISFSSVLNLISYHILEKEIKNLHHNK